jgi:hypothetical protein
MQYEGLGEVGGVGGSKFDIVSLQGRLFIKKQTYIYLAVK